MACGMKNWSGSFYANSSEVDLGDGEGEFFINTCWSLAEPETLRREKSAPH